MAAMLSDVGVWESFRCLFGGEKEVLSCVVCSSIIVGKVMVYSQIMIG